jgi:MFS family permease
MYSSKLYNGVIKKHVPLIISTLLHFLGYSPYVVLPSLAPLLRHSAEPIFLALVGVTAFSGLSSLLVGRALDRYGSNIVSVVGLFILAVGYATLGVSGDRPGAWLISGLILGVGVQATGGQTAFHILQKNRGDDSAGAHFIASLGISAAGLMLPWFVAGIGIRLGSSGVNWALSGTVLGIFTCCIILFWNYITVELRHASSKQSSEIVGPSFLENTLKMPISRFAVAASLGVIVSMNTAFATLATSFFSNGAVENGASLLVSIAGGAIFGRIFFALILSQGAKLNLVNIVFTLSIACQALVCVCVGLFHFSFLFLCVMLALYGIGSSANTALIPVLVHRHAFGAQLGLVLGQARFITTPFQVIGIFSISSIIQLFKVESEIFYTISIFIIISVIIINFYNI